MTIAEFTMPVQASESADSIARRVGGCIVLTFLNGNSGPDNLRTAEITGHAVSGRGYDHAFELWSEPTVNGKKGEMLLGDVYLKVNGGSSNVRVEFPPVIPRPSSVYDPQLLKSLFYFYARNHLSH